MSELSLLELDAQFSELLPEREALGVFTHFNFNHCHPHQQQQHHHHHHHCEQPKQNPCEPQKHDPCPPAKHDPCPPPHKPCDDDFGNYGHHPRGYQDPNSTPPVKTPIKFPQ